MMYSNKLAVALKSAGKVLREYGDQVYVPFGSEFSVFIKNMNSVRALVSVTIDGVDVGDGTQFVVNANDSIDIERFIKNGNFDQGNRLKFIERTGAVEDHRGVGIEDGLVRVEFKFERKPVVQPHSPWVNKSNDAYWGGRKNLFDGGQKIGSTSTSEHFGTASSMMNYSATVANSNVLRGVSNSAVAASVDISSQANNDVGITVPGSQSNQQFKIADWFATETETHVVVLKILGETEDNVQVRKPVTVKTKPKCVTCGTVNKARAKFCTECGTALKII